MERRDFFKGLIASALALSIAPSLLKPVLRTPEKLVYTFKVSEGVLSDQTGIECIEEEVIRIANKYPDYKLGNVEFRYAAGDEFTKPDFVLGIMTCRVELLAS